MINQPVLGAGPNQLSLAKMMPMETGLFSIPSFFFEVTIVVPLQVPDRIVTTQQSGGGNFF